MDFDNIFKEYYEKILNFCYAKIGDAIGRGLHAGSFFVLSKKMHSLRLDTNITSWLYGAAKNEIKKCHRKNKQDDVSLDDLAAIPQESNENSGTL